VSVGGKSVEKARSLLKQLFRTENADLDFGIYRIMNFKRAEVERFIDEELIKAAEAEFKELARAEASELEEELERRKKEINEYVPGTIGEGWEVLNNHDLPKVKEFLEVLEEYQTASVTEEQVQDVFNHVYEFFSRYYEDGDFIPRTRYGGRDKYYVPYNGEEVLLHWATKDMYYVKTGEYFKKYSFKAGRFRVTFKLVEAHIEQGNVKSDKKFFILHDEDPVSFDEESGEAEIRFEYRTLTEEEKAGFGRRTAPKIQEDLVDVALSRIETALGTTPISGMLRPRGGEEKSLMRKHMEAYIQRNTKDFFIHKDLKGFLTRELEFYLKNEVWDLNILEGAPESQIKLMRAKAKAIRNISTKIIEFLAQIEEFQKKMWEKKKFVLSTDFLITLDYIDECYYQKILNNKNQLNKWKQLFNFDINEEIKKVKETLDGHNNKDIELHILKQNPSLVLDTKFFDDEFKYKVLNEIDDLDNKITGILIKSENFQALNLLLNKYNNGIKYCYIDPPFNSKSTEIIYKNNFKHSSWLSLMANRFDLIKNMLLKNRGILTVAIDENEQERLGLLLSQMFPSHEKTCITVVHNPAGIQGKNFSYTHEYAYFIFPKNGEFIGKTERDDALISPFRDWGNESERNNAKTCFYPIIIKDNEIVGFGEVIPDNIHPNSSNIKQEDGSIFVYPIDNNGVERKWVYNRESVEKIKDQLFVKIINGEFTIMRKKSLFKYRTVWDKKKYYANIYGSKLLGNMIPNNSFTFPKSLYTVKDSVHATTQNDKNSIVIDYFAGSGTTGHAVLNLNKEDNGNRKFILIEMADYFDTVMKPRIEKAIFADNWKEGKPQDNNGSRKQIIKYQTFEQYEDTLNNIKFKQSEGSIQTRLDRLPDYFLTYMLDYETKDSPTRISFELFKTPFNYKIKTISGGEEKEESVDLVETFNYLLGLHVNRYRTFKDHDRTYRVEFGTRDNEQVVVIWRNIPGLDLKRDKEFIEKTILKDSNPDTIYVNGDSYLEKARPIEPEFKRLMGA